MKRALHVFLFIYFIIPIFGALLLPFPLLLEVQMSLQGMIFWHHLRLFLEDEIPNGDFSTDGEHGQYGSWNRYCKVTQLRKTRRRPIFNGT